MSTQEKTEKLKSFIKKEFGIEIEDRRVKGLAYHIAQQKGELTGQDKYKNYDHVDKMLKLLNDSFDNALEWEDVEHFTGNLFFAMRLATKRPIDTVLEMTAAYKDKDVLDSKQVQNDMFIIVQSIRKNMSNTWEYIEKTQLTGVGMIINKILKHKLDEKNKV